MVTDLKQVGEALEWLGLGARVEGERLYVWYEQGGCSILRSDKDYKNAYARDLILDALQSKRIMVLLRSPKPGAKEPYLVKLVNWPKGSHTEVQGATRTDAVLAAAVAAKEKETG